MALPAIAAAAIGSGISRAPSLSNFLFDGITTGNWGGTSKERKNQIHDIRTLRRKEYQDMVHSLKKAGLNPILAVGASPGHASAQQVQTQQGRYQGSSGGDAGIAANRMAGVAEGKAPSEIGKNIGSTNLMGTEAGNLMLGRAGLLQQYELNELEMKSRSQNTATSALLGEVYKAEAIHKGASAKEIEQRMREINQYGLPGQNWEGLIRNRITDAAGGGGGRINLNAPADAIINSGKSAWEWGKQQLFGGEEKK